MEGQTDRLKIDALSARLNDCVSELNRLRRSESELLDVQRTLRYLIDHTDAVIYAKDLDGRFTLANQALHALFGIAPGGMLGRTPGELLTPVLARRLDADHASIVAGGGRQVDCDQLSDADGLERDYLSSKFPIYDVDGAICGSAGVSTDVTEIAEQRRQLADSQQRWKVLVEHSPVAVAVIGADGCFVYLNPQAVRLYGGTDPADLVGCSSMRHVPADAAAETATMFNAALSGETVVGRRWVLRTLDERLIDVEVNAAGIHYDGIAAVQVELRNMTVQVAAEKALQDSERRWRQLFSGSPLAIGLLDENGIHLAANEALCVLLGRPEEEILGRHGKEFAHPDDIAPDRNLDVEVRSTPDGVLGAETRITRPDGSIRWTQLTIARTPGPSGEDWNLVHLQDVTDRKANEQALRDSEANLIAVAAVVQEVQSGGDARQLIVDWTRELAHANYATLLEPCTDRPALQVTASTDSSLVGTVVPLGITSATVEVYRSGKGLFLADAAMHPLASPALLALSNAHSIYIVPVRTPSATVAVLSVSWANRIEDLDDRRTGVVTLLADQTAVALRQASMLEELEMLASSDQLTRLPNRRNWDERLAFHLLQTKRTGRPLTVAIADLDRFKGYNDVFGHLAGDALLRRFAESGQAALRDGDTLARWGGEEFAIALPDCAVAEAKAVLERVRLAVPDDQTCSIGYATWDRRETAEQLVSRADQALYVAKRSGRNQTLASPVAGRS